MTFDDVIARCGESSSDGSPMYSVNVSPTSDPQLSLLPFFWKRNENVLRNFCKTLSVVLPKKKRNIFTIARENNKI